MKWHLTLIDLFAKLFIEAAGTLVPESSTYRPTPPSFAEGQERKVSRPEPTCRDIPITRLGVLSAIKGVSR